MLEINVKNVSLVLEGGTFRTVFTMGILDAFLDAEIMFPHISGVSAGITYACSYVSQQKGRNIRITEKYRNDKRYVGIRNFKTDKSLFGIRFAYDDLPNVLEPTDWETFRGYKGKFLIGVTNALTGKTEYMNGLRMDKSCKMLQATCAIPFLFPAIHIRNVPYYDGGLCAPITIHKAEEDGYQKHVIILTRTDDYRKKCGIKNKLAAKRMQKEFPSLSEPLLVRHQLYNDTVEYCRQLGREGKAIVFQPAFQIKNLEDDVTLLRKGYDMGYQMAMDRMDELKSFCGLG